MRISASTRTISSPKECKECRLDHALQAATLGRAGLSKHTLINHVIAAKGNDDAWFSGTSMGENWRLYSDTWVRSPYINPLVHGHVHPFSALESPFWRYTPCSNATRRVQGPCWEGKNKHVPIAYDLASISARNLRKHKKNSWIAKQTWVS
jgi:hypothetical protein